MKRRKFIAFLGSAAAVSPLAALAQRANRTQRIGVLMGLAENDPEGQARYAALRERLRKLGWTEGGNIDVTTRWAAGDIARTQAYAAELVGLAPDVILVNTPPGLAALQTVTRSIPVVFVQVVDAAESVVKSPARPGGNITGFYTFFDYSMTGKWLQILKEAAPRVRRVAAMQNPKHPAWSKYLDAIRSIAPSLGIEVVPAPVQEPAEIERVIERFARVPDGALVVLPDTFTTVHRGLIVAAAARYRVPSIGQSKSFATAGGLMSYGADLVDLMRLAGTYVDRILRGAKPAELPVQASTKLELVINLKTAKALGLTIPQAILLRADNVIE
jgi:putative ABC transport system substrate-binding protein